MGKVELTLTLTAPRSSRMFSRMSVEVGEMRWRTRMRNSCLESPSLPRSSSAAILTKWMTPTSSSATGTPSKFMPAASAGERGGTECEQAKTHASLSHQPQLAVHTFIKLVSVNELVNDARDGANLKGDSCVSQPAREVAFIVLWN